MAGVLYIRDTGTGEFVPVPALVGPPGPGVPAGGAAGQVLVKSGEADYAAEWRENDASKLGGKGPEEYASASVVAAHEASIGDAWVSGKTYAVGDYCISDNRLYKCKTEHTSVDAFSADYWDAVSVASELASGGNMMNYAYPTYNSDYAEPIGENNIDRVTFIKKKNGTIVVNGLFRTKSDVPDGSKFLNFPVGYEYTGRTTNQPWTYAVSVSTGMAYCVRCGDNNISPWGKDIPSGSLYVINFSY